MTSSCPPAVDGGKRRGRSYRAGGEQTCWDILRTRLQCDQAGITPIVPKTLTSNSLADGRFDKQDFVYIAAEDEYRCPAGQRAIKRFTTTEHGMTLSKYWSSARPRGPLKAQHDGRLSAHHALGT
jgi:hypothetical protein